MAGKRARATRYELAMGFCNSVRCEGGRREHEFWVDEDTDRDIEGRCETCGEAERLEFWA